MGLISIDSRVSAFDLMQVERAQQQEEEFEPDSDLMQVERAQQQEEEFEPDSDLMQVERAQQQEEEFEPDSYPIRTQQQQQQGTFGQQQQVTSIYMAWAALKKMASLTSESEL